MPPTSRPSMAFSSSRRLALLLLSFAVACNSDIVTGPQVPANLLIVSGDKQTTIAGTPPASPLVVRVTNSGGAPLANITVNWAVGVGGGTVTAATSTTDANGETEVAYTPGTKVDSAKVVASIELLNATFSITLIAGPPSAVSAFSGNGAAAVVGSELPLFAKVVDANGNGIPGVVVTWSAANGGVLSATTGTSDAGGLATTTLTLGTTPGPYVVTATSPGLATATFTVTGV